MSTKTLEKRTKKLAKEVDLLRSFVIGQMGRDPEGEYNPKFVEEMLKAAADNKIEHKFTTKKSLLAYLNVGKN